MPRPASGPVPSVVDMICDSGIRMKAPSTAPHRRPMPPTTAAIVGMIPQLMSRTWSGNTASAQKL
jgi:hypothetical protein